MFTKKLQTAFSSFYSKKAESIIAAILKSGSSRMTTTRDADGKILFAAEEAWHFSDFSEKCQKALAKTRQNLINTVRTRAQDTGTIVLGGDELSRKDVNLFCLIALGRYKESAMRFWFGSKEYDEMVGKPFNPMISAQRQTILSQIESLQQKISETEIRVKDEYKAQISELYKQRDAAVDESNKNFSLQISELKTRMASIS